MVDAQVAFLEGPGAVPGAAALGATLAELVDRARTAGAVLVHLQNDGPPGGVDEPDTPGWQLHLPVQDGPDEIVIRKTADDGFEGTSLAAVLSARGVRSLVLCGVQSEMCVSATARTALSLGFRVVLPHDAHATYDVPATPRIACRVPSAMVSRVAEWALGDGIDLVPGAADVVFAHRRADRAHTPSAGVGQSPTS